MATPLTRAEWLDECAKLAKTYEEAMTDEANALVERVAMLPDGDAWPSTVELLCDLRDCVETQAREIERLRGALRNIRALATKRQNVWGPDGCLTDIECFAIAALAGDSHDLKR